MNEKDLLNQIIKREHSREGLSYTEKSHMLQRIMHTANAELSPYMQSKTHFIIRLAAACTLVFFVGMSGATYASGAALPGEFLYTFKVTVREPLIAITKKDTAADEYALERVSERYREIAVLAEAQKLTEPRGRQALAYLKEQTDTVTKQAVLKKPAAKEAASVTAYLQTSRDVSSTIAAHQEALQDIKESSDIADTAAQAVLEEALSVAESGVETIADATHEVIKSIPNEISQSEVKLAVSDLEDRVAIITPEPSNARSAKEAPAMMAMMATSMSMDAAPVEQTGIEATLTDVDTLLAQLDSIVATEDAAIVQSRSATSEDTIATLYAQAKEAKQNGDYALAIELLHKALQIYETTQKTTEVQAELKAENQSSSNSIISSSGSKDREVEAAASAVSSLKI